MTFDSNYGHYRGADGTARGFAPAQGSAAAAEVSAYLTGLESWWKFDTATGPFTDSVSGTVMTEVNTPPSMTGVIGQAAVVSYLDASRGTTSAAALMSAAEVNGGAGAEGTYTAHPFTVCGWFYPENVGTASPFYLYERQTTGHANGINWYMGPYAGSDANDVQFDFGMSGGHTLKVASTAKTYAKDEWHFVAMRYFGCGYDSGASPPGDAGDRRFTGNYVNEKQVMVVSGGAGSGSLSTIAYQQADNASHLVPGTVFSIGDSVAGKSAGGIDLLGIWRDRLLTNAEILELYELTVSGTGYPFPSPSLLFGLRNWWKFDDAGSYPDSVTGVDVWTEVNSPTTATGKINLSIPFPYTGDTSGAGLSYTGNDLDVGDGTAAGDLSLTVTAWVYQDVGQGAQGKSLLDFQYGFYLNTGHPGYVYTLRTEFWLQTSGGAATILASPAVQTGAWNFVFLRYYNLTDTPTAGSNSYHCGIVTDAGLFTSTPHEVVGGYKGATGTCKVNVPLYDLQGKLDLVGMWTRPLSDEELISLYTTTNAGTDHPFS